MVDDTRRHISNLADKDQNLRHEALTGLLDTFDAAYTENMLKPVLKWLSDTLEKCRALAYTLFQRLLQEYPDPTLFLPYLLPVLVKRLDAYDLEGTDYIPETQRPTPSQQPHVLAQPIEISEEIRLQIAQTVHILINVTQTEHLVPHYDELINILRALVMDKDSGEVRIEACAVVQKLCTSAPETLLHYSEALARATHACLVHKHAKVRIAGLNTIYSILTTSTWKFTTNIIETLVGFRDPNIVPIRDFYEPSTKFNYMGTLVGDRSSAVREAYYKTIGEMLTQLKDRYDLETRLVPYLLSGLFDNLPDIQDMTFEYLEEIGELYEEEKEKEIREYRQFGIQELWTAEGQLADLPLPPPFAKRPRLGARLFIRQYIRRYLKPIFAEMKDWISDSQVRSSNLLLSLIIFTEDYMTQHIDTYLNSMYVAFRKANKEVISTLGMWVKLVGRFVLARSWKQNVFSALRGELGENAQETVCQVLGNLLEGIMEAQVPNQGLPRIEEHIDELLSALEHGDARDTRHFPLAALLASPSSHPTYFGNLSAITSRAEQISMLIFTAKNEVQPLYKNLETIVGDCTLLHESLMNRLESSEVATWHRFDANWLVFFHLVSTAGYRSDRVNQLAFRIMRAKQASSIHKAVLDLVADFEKPAYETITTALRKPEVCLQALTILSSYKSIDATPELLASLRKASMMEALATKQLALSVLKVAIDDLATEEPEVVQKMMHKGFLIVPQVAGRLVELLDDAQESVRVKAALCLGGVAGLEVGYEFTFDNISKAIEALVAIALAEGLTDLKEAVDCVLRTINVHNTLIIRMESAKASEAGMLKRADYLAKIAITQPNPL